MAWIIAARRIAAGLSRRIPFGPWTGAVLVIALAAGCTGDDGDTGPAGPPGPGGGATNSVLEQGDTPPGVNVALVSLSGGSGAGGSFKVGDTITARFTLTKDDGSAWDIAEMSTGRALVSGPSFNYQRVIPEVANVATAAVRNADGSYSFTFATAIPAVYAAPLNDTPTFGPGDGELTGQPLLAGTYTLGLYFAWNYTVDGESHRDVGNTTADFLFGGATTMEHREAVLQANCNNCHQDLQAHGGLRHEVTLCLLCHTAGAEDKNVASAAGGTPDVTIEFKVMIHRIHAGRHLPSVLGVDTNPDGSRNYGAAPKPYQIVGFGNSIHDFSEVSFPAWPWGLIAMPRDQGYTALPAAAKAQEDAIRTGPADCAACHGDPDGAGPLAAPAQGDLYKSQPARNSCGACHDDINWGFPYTANGQTMPSQANNSNCVLCHEQSGASLAIADAHRHPLHDPTFNPGLNVDVLAVDEAGASNGNGNLDPGEKVSVTFTMTDDAGAAVLPSVAGTSLSAVLSGPTHNYNLLLNGSIPTAALSGAQPFTIPLPSLIQLEFLGDSTAGFDVFTTAFTPHWNVAGALTSVLVRTASSSSTTLAAPASAPQNYVDVVSGAAFTRDDYVVIDDGVAGSEEYLRLQFVDGNRLWFSSPATSSYKAGLVADHSAGAALTKVTLVTKVAGTDYALDPALGTITELIEFGAGNAVLATYTSDFVMPASYPLALNDSPDLGEEWGGWTAKAIADGTYSVSIWGSRALTLNLYGEVNSYRGTSEAHLADFLVGAATGVEPYGLISSGQNCNACHKDLTFHGGGRRGFEACVLCHGTAGSEDRPQYVAGNAPPTTGATINLRTMLHKIHMGAELANASTYTLVGFGSAAWPNNFTAHTYEEIEFPALPQGVKNCQVCHGAGNMAWHEPAERDHPTMQGVPVLEWRAVCNSCHDSVAATAHIDLMTTTSGVESCSICHQPGKEWNVPKMHKSY
jgi:hypothetical protein